MYGSPIVPSSLPELAASWLLTDLLHSSLLLGLVVIFFWRDLGVVVPALVSAPLGNWLGGFRGSLLAFGGVFLACAVLAMVLARGERDVPAT